tara:strand:- start:207 stop:725 length:519 start_codon:yes stop_codon:yes gene_type:complete
MTRLQTLVYDPKTKSYTLAGSDGAPTNPEPVELAQGFSDVLNAKELQSVAVGGLEALVVGELAEGVIGTVGGGLGGQFGPAIAKLLAAAFIPKALRPITGQSAATDAKKFLVFSAISDVLPLGEWARQITGAIPLGQPVGTVGGAANAADERFGMRQGVPQSPDIANLLAAM